MAVIGLDFGGTRIKMGIVAKGQMLNSKTITVTSCENFEKMIPELENHIDQMIEKSNTQKITGIGLAFPSIVDSDKMKILSDYVKYSDASQFDFVRWAKNKWRIPVALENDARAALVGEWKCGSGKGYDNIVMITIGTGIGSAVLIEGKLLKGSHYLAGNLGGHICVNHNGSECNCGFIGCLETEASTWAIPNIAKKSSSYSHSALALEEKLDFESIFRLSEQKDTLAMKLKQQALKLWSIGVVNLIHSFDPEIVVIGGGVMRSEEIILPFITGKIDEYSWLPEGSVKVVSASQPDWAGVLGMAAIVESNQRN